MIPFSTSPAENAKELVNFNKNLFKGLKTLSKQGPIDTGDRKSVV